MQNFKENDFEILHIFALRSTKKRNDGLCKA